MLNRLMSIVEVDGIVFEPARSICCESFLQYYFSLKVQFFGNLSVHTNHISLITLHTHIEKVNV